MESHFNDYIESPQTWSLCWHHTASTFTTKRVIFLIFSSTLVAEWAVRQFHLHFELSDLYVLPLELFFHLYLLYVLIVTTGLAFVTVVLIITLMSSFGV